MLELDIPGFGFLSLEHLVLDFNGTLAHDGALLPGVAGNLRRLAGELSLHVVTADTHGECARALGGLPVRLTVLERPAIPRDSGNGEDEAKLALVRSLGAKCCAAVGNGRNDALMLQAAAVGVAVVQGECAAMAALRGADLMAPDILAALGLFLVPARLLAGLRQ